MPKNLAIKVARAEKDMTQKALAEAVGISRQTMNAIEKGEYNPTIKLCRAICRVLEKTLDELFWEETDNEEENNLDEAQELKMLHIEHNAYQLVFWGLVAALFIQSALEPGNLKLIAGECIVFFTVCLYVIAACLKNGIWERKLKPSRKTNLALSLISGAVLGVFWFCVSLYNYRNLYGSLATSAMAFLASFLLVYAGLAVTAKLYHNRVKKLDEEIEEA